MRLKDLDVGVGFDLLGELGIGINHFPQENGGAAEVTLREAIAFGLGDLGIGAQLGDRPGKDSCSIEAAFDASWIQGRI